MRAALILTAWLALVLIACGEEWTQDEKVAAQIILLSQKEHMAATQISNSKPGFTVLASDEAAQMYAHLGEALRYAESVPEEVLRKAHPTCQSIGEMSISAAFLELLSKVVYGFVMRRRDPGVLHSRI